MLLMNYYTDTTSKGNIFYFIFLQKNKIVCIFFSSRFFSTYLTSTRSLGFHLAYFYFSVFIPLALFSFFVAVFLFLCFLICCYFSVFSLLSQYVATFLFLYLCCLSLFSLSVLTCQELLFLLFLYMASSSVSLPCKLISSIQQTVILFSGFLSVPILFFLLSMSLCILSGLVSTPFSRVIEPKMHFIASVAKEMISNRANENRELHKKTKSWRKSFRQKNRHNGMNGRARIIVAKEK